MTGMDLMADGEWVMVDVADHLPSTINHFP